MERVLARLTHMPEPARTTRRWPRGILVALLPLALLGERQCGRIAPSGSGLMQFGGSADSRAWNEPQALGVSRLFNWADLEPQDGVYDWSEFDDLLRIAHENGKKLAPRVYTNEGTFGQATPDWVFDQGAESYHSDEGDSPRQPVPTDPVFAQKWAEFVAVMGERYDGDPEHRVHPDECRHGGLRRDGVGLPREPAPAGMVAHRADRHDAAGIDLWRRGFPTTHLVLMENFIGDDIAETVSDYAVKHGFYLQANLPYQSPKSQAILAALADQTHIILEVENNGCQAATGPAFDAMTTTVFDYGFPVDYLTVCGNSFDDADRIEATYRHLRHDGP